MAPKHRKRDGGRWSTKGGNSIESEQILGGEENELDFGHKRPRFESHWPTESFIRSLNKYSLTNCFVPGIKYSGE